MDRYLPTNRPTYLHNCSRASILETRSKHPREMVIAPKASTSIYTMLRSFLKPFITTTPGSEINIYRSLSLYTQRLY